MRRSTPFSFALGEIGFRLAVHQLLENLFGALQLICSDQSVAQMRQRVRHTEGIAGPAIGVDQPFQRLQPVRHFCGKFVQQAYDGVVFARIEHGNAQPRNQRQCPFGLLGLQKGFRHFLRQPKILFVAVKDL